MKCCYIWAVVKDFIAMNISCHENIHVNDHASFGIMYTLKTRDFFPYSRSQTQPWLHLPLPGLCHAFVAQRSFSIPPWYQDMYISAIFNTSLIHNIFHVKILGDIETIPYDEMWTGPYMDSVWSSNEQRQTILRDQVTSTQFLTSWVFRIVSANHCRSYWHRV